MPKAELHSVTRVWAEKGDLTSQHHHQGLNLNNWQLGVGGDTLKSCSVWEALGLGSGGAGARVLGRISPDWSLHIAELGKGEKE